MQRSLNENWFNQVRQSHITNHILDAARLVVAHLLSCGLAADKSKLRTTTRQKRMLLPASRTQTE